jgi:anti-sigma factor (TIGR02949 family)
MPETRSAECRVAEQQLQGYLDSMLGPMEVARVESHLATCRDCARAYAFEARFRQYVKSCCAGSDDQCREELRRKLERCRHELP